MMDKNILNLREVHIEGYPPLEVIIRHFNSIHILIRHAKKSEGGIEVLRKWDEDRSRELANPISIVVQPTTVREIP
jgi:hypothetical protein